MVKKESPLMTLYTSALYATILLLVNRGGNTLYTTIVTGDGFGNALCLVGTVVVHYYDFQISECLLLYRSDRIRYSLCGVVRGDYD